MDKTEKRIILYSSVLISLIINSPKLLALRENGFVAQYWHFNLAELLFQVFVNAGSCYLFFYINLRNNKSGISAPLVQKRLLYFFFNPLILLVLCFAFGIIQRHTFHDVQLKKIYWSSYLTRYFLSGLFAGILIKIIFLLRESKQKDSENEKLKTAYLQAELELLKEQLNPHFLFNSLSSLSGVVREDPAKAQKYIGHLSKIFRYALTQSGTHLVPLADELAMIKSYGQLLKMRFEEAFQLNIDVDTAYEQQMIPHLSLQPLLENAAKHNSATLAKPLKINIFINNGCVAVSNNRQPIAKPENSTGIGLGNLNSRYKILMHREIVIVNDENCFTVNLPFKR